MQIPDRLNPGGSLPIAGPTPTPRPPIKLRELTFPDLDTPTSPQPTPDYSDLIQELLESIPTPDTPGPSQAAPPPTMPAPSAPPSPLPGMPPLPIGEQGFLPIPGLEQLPGAELPHAGFYGNIPAEVGAAVPPGFFGAITSPVLGGLGKAVGVLGDVERTTGIEAPAQQAWTSPMAVAAAGLTPGGAERQEMRREATVDGTALGRWLDGQYGNVTSMDALRKMHTDLRTAQREGGIALEIASGFASPTAMIPMPLIDPLFGVLLKGVWKGIKIPFKARGFIADLLSSEKPAKTLTSEQVAQHQRAKETITQSHPRAREGIEIPKNPIQEVVDETTSGNYAFVRYTTDIINGEEAEVIRVYKEVDPLSTEYQMYRDLEAQGLGVLVRPGETVNPQVLDNYRARNEARQAADEANVNTVPDAPVEPEVEVAPTASRQQLLDEVERTARLQDEAEANFDAASAKRAPAPRMGTTEWEEFLEARRGMPSKKAQVDSARTTRREARAAHKAAVQAFKDATGETEVPTTLTPEPDVPITEPAAAVEGVEYTRGTPSMYESIDPEDALVDWVGIDQRIANNYEGMPPHTIVADTRHLISNLENQYGDLLPPEVPEEYENWFNELEDSVGQANFAIEHAERLSAHLAKLDVSSTRYSPDATLGDLQESLDDAINNVAEQLDILGYPIEPAAPSIPTRTVNELLSDIEANKGFMEAKDARPGHAPVNYAPDINALDEAELDTFYRRIVGDPTIPGAKSDESSQFISDIFGSIVENSYRRRGMSPPPADPNWRFPPGRTSFQYGGTPAVPPTAPVARSNARASFSRMKAEGSELDPGEYVQMSEEDYLPPSVMQMLNDTRRRVDSGISKFRNLEAYDPDLTDDVVDAVKRGRAAFAEAGVPTQRGTSTVYQEGVGGLSVQSPSHPEHLIRAMPDGNEKNFAMNLRYATIVVEVDYEKFVNSVQSFTRGHKDAPTKKVLDDMAADLRESIDILELLARLGPDHPVAGRADGFPFHGDRADRSKYADELHGAFGATDPVSDIPEAASRAQSTMAGKATPREGGSTRPLPPKENVVDNYRKPLVIYTDRLFHETSIDDVGVFLGQVITTMDRVWVANTSNLARGQRGQGVILEFTPGRLEGQIDAMVPFNRVPMSWDGGESAFYVTHSTPSDWGNNLVSITVLPDAQVISRGMARAFRNQMSGAGNFQSFGPWEKIENADGSVTYLNPNPPVETSFEDVIGTTPEVFWKGEDLRGQRSPARNWRRAEPDAPIEAAPAPGILSSGDPITARPGMRYRSFGRPLDAIGDDVSSSSSPFEFPDAYTIEFRGGHLGKDIPQHPGSIRGPLHFQGIADSQNVTRIFIDSSELPIEGRAERLASDITDLKSRFPDAEIIEVRVNPENPDLPRQFVRNIEEAAPTGAAPDPVVPDAAAGIQPDMFGRANKAVYISDADMSQSSFNLNPDEQASGLEQIRNQVDNGEKDKLDALADASNIMEARTPGTGRPQYLMDITETRDVSPTAIGLGAIRYRIFASWPKSRLRGTLSEATPDEIKEITDATPETVGWVVAETETGPFQIRGTVVPPGTTQIMPGEELSPSFATLEEAIDNLRWDTGNEYLVRMDPDGNPLALGGGSGTAFPGAPGDYSGPTGQIRLNNAINVDLMQLKTLKRLIASLTEKGITGAATRLRIRAGDIADRLDTLIRRIEDQDFPGDNAMGLRRTVYQETSTIRAVSPDERSVFIARRDEPERMGMGLGVQEKVEFINSRLTDHRFTRQILDQTIAEKGEDWEDLVQLIYGDIYDEAEELRVLADNLPVEGTEASQALAAGLRDEVYDEIGEVDPRWRIWDVSEGGGGPSGAGDPEIARELERAAAAGERVVYIPNRPNNMADKDFGAPDPPNMNKRSEGDDWGFISLRNVRSLDAFYDEDVIVHDSAAIRHIYTWTPMRFVDDTVRKNTPAGRLMTSWMMAQVADDQWVDVTLQATFDAYAKKGRFGFGKATMNLPIDRDTGFWGDSGLHWADVWSFWNGKHKGHIDKYADRLDGKLRHLIAEFSNVVNEEVEQIREINGLPRRKKKRGPGEVYIPRKVEGIRDKETGKLIPFEKPTNPNHERLWEMATEAYQRHGVDYTTNPRAVLELHLRSALKEIRHHQMEEMMERLDLAVTIMRKVTDPETGRVTTVPGPLVNPAIWAKKVETQEAYIEATQRLKEVSKAIFGEEIWSRMGQGISNIHVDLDLAADISRAQEAMRSAPEFAENLKRLNDEYDELAGKMVEVTSADGTKRMERTGGSVTRLKRESTTARKAYHKHIKRLKNSAYVEITGGKSGLFGGAVADGLYPITANRFKTKFFLTEDYNEIKDFIRGIDPEQREGFGPAAIQGFQTVVNVSRFLASVGDFAMPFINLFPVLGENPKIWAQATLNHYKAWADPTVQSRLIRENIQEYYDLATNGVPVGDPEFFAALAPGQGINLENVMRKWEQKRPPANKAEKAIFKSLKEAQHGGKLIGRQTFGRFQTSYQTGLGHARMMLLKSLRSSWKGTDNELYSYIRNMTGGMDSRRSGIMPGQRAFEGMFLAFSPRLFRSTVALTADAMQALPRMGAKRLGKGTGSTAQQRRALKTISQLIAGVYGIYYLTAKYGFDMEDQEILDGMTPSSGRRFLSVQINGDWVGVGGQIRALMQFSWAMMGLMTEGNLGEGDRKWSDLWSTNSMKNPFVYLYMSRGAPGTRAVGAIGESMLGVDMLPFDNPDGAVDLLTHYGEGSLPFALQHYLESNTWESATMEFFGARASFNPRDRATQYITSGEENVYTDQPPMTKWLVNELIETEQSEFDSIEMKRRKELLALQGTDFNYLAWMGIENKSSGARGWAAEEIDFGPPADLDSPDPNSRALAEYYSLFRDKRVKDAEGISMPNGNDMFSRLLDFKANNPVSQGGFGWSNEQKQYVVANTNLRPVPWFVFQKVGGARADSIKRSQKMREQMFIDMGRRDLAMISHRLFYMLPPGQGAYSDVIDQMVEGSPPDFGPSNVEDLWEWQRERLVGAGAP